MKEALFPVRRRPSVGSLDWAGWGMGMGRADSYPELQGPGRCARVRLRERQSGDPTV